MKKLLAQFSARRALAGLALATAAASAHAADVTVLDTGTPTGSSGTFVLNTAQALAGEFSINAGTTVSQLSAYLTTGAGQVGEVFSFEIFSNTGFINGRNPQPLYAVSATFDGDGWNSQAANWTAATTGDYWLAIFAGSGTNLDAPGEVSSSSGSVPAQGFAFESGGRFSSNGAPAIGLRIDGVSPVPEPSAALSMLLGLAALGAAALKRKPRA